MKPGEDGAVDLRPLLDQRLGRAHRHVVAGIGNLLLGRRHHALGRIGQPTQEVEQHLGGRVERQRHRRLPDIIDARRRFYLGNLTDNDLGVLATKAGALNANRTGSVIDMSRIQQSPKGTSSSNGKAADKVWKADLEHPPPWDEPERHKPVQPLTGRVALLPVAVNRNHLFGVLVDRDEVG